MTAYELRISDWSSDVCSSDLKVEQMADLVHQRGQQVDPPRGRRAGRRIEQMIRIAAGELRRIAGRGIDEPARPGRIVVDRDDAVLVGREGIAAEILDLERERVELLGGDAVKIRDRKSTRLNSSH